MDSYMIWSMPVEFHEYNPVLRSVTLSVIIIHLWMPVHCIEYMLNVINHISCRQSIGGS
jgi:hypothetical protein